MKSPWRPGSREHMRARGSAAETAAVSWLEGEGYRVVARNVTTAAGEIDVVAFDRGCLCFVEVKARASRRFGPALAAVDRRKQRRLARAAALYLARQGTEVESRFDVLAIDRHPDGWRYSLIRDAFVADY